MPTMKNAPFTPLHSVADSVYLYVSVQGPHISWLTHALADLGSVTTVAVDENTVGERVAMLHPQCVFLDFSDVDAARAGRIVDLLRRDWPEVLLIGTGRETDNQCTLLALRSGVDDFVFVSASNEAVQSVMQALMVRRLSDREKARGRTIALLGARPGLGVSTLASNLAVSLQEMRNAAQAQPQAANRLAQRLGVVLLDLGLPARDGLLYLGQESSFSFVDGVRNLKRLDQTLLQTALAHHPSGMALLPLPASLAQIKEVSHAESVSLIRRLSDFYDFLITDLGGFSTVDFVAQSVRDAEKVWVVCDQSIGGIVSTSTLLRELRDRGLDTQHFALVLNKYSPSIGLPASDIAARLGIPLGHVIPDRSTPLLIAASKGELISRVARNDPYVTALGGMIRSLGPWPGGTPSPSAGPGIWARYMAQLIGKWKS